MRKFLIKFFKNIPYISLTIDGWSSDGNTHSLLSVTGHYLDTNFEPCFFVLGAKPVYGKHNSPKFAALLKNCLDELEIPLEKVHLIVRDAGSSMIATTNLLGKDSIDCFAHKLQLVS